MRDLLDQIDTTVNAGLYYPALFATLSIPEVCGALGSENGYGTKDKYVAWFDKYVRPKCMNLVQGTDCYRFRCSLLHEGSSELRESSYSRVLFVEPQATTNIFHMNVLGDALNIDVRLFCADVTKSAREWLDEVEGTEPYEQNYRTSMRRYPEGLKPYIVGVPVIS